MKVLVTGGAGFIGSHIVEKLIDNGCQVFVIDNLSTGSRENIHCSATFIEMDITDNRIMSVFEAERFDYVIHQAGQTMVPKSIEAPDFDCQVNIMGTVNILEACRKTQVKRIVFASTAAVYGDATEIPIRESAVLQPSSFYGLSKLVVEKYLDLYQKLYGLEYVVLRYANVYGERQGDAGEGGVISIFAKRIYAGQPVLIYGDGGQTRDFVYAKDVANANYIAMLTSQANTVYNISTQTQTTVDSLIDLFEEAAGKKVERQYNKPRSGDIYHSSLANEAAVATLGWKPIISLAAGLVRTYKSLTQ